MDMAKIEKVLEEIWDKVPSDKKWGTQILFFNHSNRVNYLFMGIYHGEWDDTEKEFRTHEAEVLSMEELEKALKVLLRNDESFKRFYYARNFKHWKYGDGCIMLGIEYLGRHQEEGEWPKK